MCIGRGQLYENEKVSLCISETKVMKILGIHFGKISMSVKI